jgi:hypothetical protein
MNTDMFYLNTRFSGDVKDLLNNISIMNDLYLKESGFYQDFANSGIS